MRWQVVLIKENGDWRWKLWWYDNCIGKVVEVAEKILRALSNKNLYVTQKPKNPLIEGLKLLFIIDQNK